MAAHLVHELLHPHIHLSSPFWTCLHHAGPCCRAPHEHIALPSYSHSAFTKCQKCNIATFWNISSVQPTLLSVSGMLIRAALGMSPIAVIATTLHIFPAFVHLGRGLFSWQGFLAWSSAMWTLSAKHRSFKTKVFQIRQNPFSTSNCVRYPFHFWPLCPSYFLALSPKDS